jgi:hypothetical protein
MQRISPVNVVLAALQEVPVPTSRLGSGRTD